MKVFHLQREFYRLSRLDASELSPTARERWAVLRSWLALRNKGLSAAEAAAGCLKSRATLYRWWRRFLADGPRALAPRSRRPRRVRQNHWPPDLLPRLEKLRREFPLWGKAKLTPLLRRAGLAVSESMVGRALRRLMERGVIQPLSVLRRGKWKRSIFQRKHAVRLPKDLVARATGRLDSTGHDDRHGASGRGGQAVYGLRCGQPVVRRGRIRACDFFQRLAVFGRAA